MLGDKLRAAREAKGFTLERLADLYKAKFPESGINKGTLSKYENGKQEPMVSTVDNLAEILGASVDHLLGKANRGYDFAGLKGVYLDFAKDAQKNAIDPEDIKLAIETIKRLRNKQ